MPWLALLRLSIIIVASIATGRGVRINDDAHCSATFASRCGAGRRDADAADPVGRMPAETLTAEQLRSAFAAKGISVQELVALSGAHTVPPVCTCACCRCPHFG